MTAKRFVILDRDGTINKEKHYLSDPDEFVLLPGAVEGMQQFWALGLGLAVVTNQSPIGRGMFTEAQLGSIHERMTDLLSQEDIHLDGIYFCPHHPDDGCDCRKPEPGMILQAAEELGFDPALGFVIGDKQCDIELGQRVGATTFLVRTGYGEKELEAGKVFPDFVVADLVEAAAVIEQILVGDEKEARIRKHILASIAAKQRVMETLLPQITAAADLISESMAEGGKLMLCGNGGSAADCQHIAAEFVSVLNQDFCREGLPAIALTTDTSFLTANANDYGFEGVFRRQVQALGKPGDVLLGISTSGGSKNVLAAVEYAKENGIQTIGFTGGRGGALAGKADVVITVPSLCTQYIQELHIMIGHIICDLVEQKLFG